MTPLFALAVNGFREAGRNRVTVVVIGFAAALLLSSSLLTEVTVSTYSRVMIDIGLGLMTLVSASLAIFTSSGLLSREIERRTIFLVVTKPVSRATFLVGRYLGTALTLTAMVALMALLFWLEMALFGGGVTWSQVAAVGGLWIEVLVLAAIGFLFSSFSSQLVSAFVTASLFIAGHLSADVYNLAKTTKTAGLMLVGRVTYYLLPNLDRLDFRREATYALPVAPGDLALGAGYALAYAAVAISLAVILFQRRDFK